MRISAKAEYACLALIELARTGPAGAPSRVRLIAEAHGIPERYLVQILIQLKAAGLVHSARGASGGYMLARAAEAISVAEVLGAIEGLNDSPPKTESPAGRALADLIEEARVAEHKVLDETTIAQLLQKISTPPHDWVL
jgi:Rrf2 family transcriptional regulator, cysteine metabolism repressor